MAWNQSWDDFFRQTVSFEWKHPIFVMSQVHSWVFTWNAELRNFDFQKIVEPYTAFQELSMWVGAQARPERPIVEISDEVRLEAHGFDKKFSFRKPKSK